MRTIMIAVEGVTEAIVTCGGRKRGGSQPRIVGRRSTGSRAIITCRSAPTRAPEASRSPHSSGDRILNEVDVAIEVEAEWVGTHASHCHDGRQIPLLATSDHRHWRAVTRRFRHMEGRLSQGDRFEADSRVIIICCCSFS